MELLCSFATEVRSARHEAELAACKLAEQVAKVGELELKAELPADNAGKIGDQCKPFSAMEVELLTTKSAFGASEAIVKAKN